MALHPSDIQHLVAATIDGVLSPPSPEEASSLSAPITFPGGDYLAPTGGAVEVDTAIRHLLAAYFLHTDPPPEPLRVQALRLSLAVLHLSDHVSVAAGFSRHDRHADALKSAVDDEHRERLANALTMSRQQLEEASGAPMDVLEPLVTETANDASWEATPILCDGGHYLVAGADRLLVSLRHHLIVLADQHAWRGVLAQRFAAASGTGIRQSLRRLGWEETSLVAAEDSVLPVTQELWTFDSDGAVLVTILADDLSTYDLDDPEAPWPAERYRDGLSQLRDELLTALFVGESTPHKLLHLVVLAGLARPSAWFDEAPGPVLQAPEISLHTGDLETVSVAEQGDSLALWRFVLDANRLGTGVITFEPLELFALWSMHRHSFYLGDDRRPTGVMPQGFAQALREEVVLRRDRHGAPGPVGRGLVEIVRRWDDLDVPIYRPLAANIPGVCVEANDLQAWVLSTPGDRTLGQLVDAVAFWLWQLAPEVDDGRLEVHVEMTDSSEVEVRRAGTLITVSLNPERVTALRSADNAGERCLVRALLEVLQESWSETKLYQVVDRVAPLGPKKMILAFEPGVEQALDSRQLPPDRSPLRDSDDAQALDELGEYLRGGLGLAEGSIAADRRVPILWSAIQFHLRQLTDLISTLDPRGLLEALIGVNERLLQRGAFDRYTVPTRQACFGEVSHVADRLRERLQRQAIEGTAVRFVIECLAAQPPQGLRPFTLEVQDRLVALASQVCARGGVSDAIREGLDDTQLSILGSGRLGVGREGRFYSGREQFLDRFLVGEIRRAHRFFPGLWDQSEADDQAVGDAEMLNEAAIYEWGATLTEILSLFAALVDLSDRMPATALPLPETIERLATILDWQTDKVRTVIEHFALRPREALLVPGAPFRSHDVYPWRYGRRLSNIRRPLVIRPGREGDELVYGFRAVDAAGRYLAHEIDTARLKVESIEMQQAITTLRQRDDLRFNQEIAALYEQVPSFIVRERVTHVGPHKIARPSGEALGDVDVLVADPIQHVLHAVDTKNLAAGRTSIEIARELRRTFKSESGKAAAIDVHLERADWLTRHIPQTLRWLGLDATERNGWSVEPSIVVDAEVTASFLTDLPMPVVDAAMLADKLQEREVPSIQRS